MVQYDPPQNPSAFVHRCGRTARLGKEGRAFVMLQPQEDTYVDYLRVKHVSWSWVETLRRFCSGLREISFFHAVQVPMTEMSSVESAPDRLELVRKLAAGDRDIYEKGKLAFVSYIR